MSESAGQDTWNIIPSIILQDKGLSNGAKLIYGDLYGLSRTTGYCWATNKHFANKYNVHKNTISHWINELEKNGYIKIEIIQNMKGYDRKIFMTEKGLIKSVKPQNDKPHNECVNTPQQKVGETINNIAVPSQQNAEENNTLINTTNNTFERQAQRRETNSMVHRQIKPKNSKYNYQLDRTITVECYCGHTFVILSSWIATKEGSVVCNNIECEDPHTGKQYEFQFSFLRRCKEFPPGVIILKDQKT